MVVVPFYILTHSTHFLHIPLTLVILCLFVFYSGHPKGVRWHLVAVLIWSSLMIRAIEHLFVLIDHVCTFFVELSIQVLCPFSD